MRYSRISTGSPKVEFMITQFEQAGHEYHDFEGESETRSGQINKTGPAEKTKSEATNRTRNQSRKTGNREGYVHFSGGRENDFKTV